MAGSPHSYGQLYAPVTGSTVATAVLLRGRYYDFCQARQTCCCTDGGKIGRSTLSNFTVIGTNPRIVEIEILYKHFANILDMGESLARFRTNFTNNYARY